MMINAHSGSHISFSHSQVALKSIIFIIMLAVVVVGTYLVVNNEAWRLSLGDWMRMVIVYGK